MPKKNSYAVLRFIEHGKKCHKGSDYVTGQLLAEYLRYHPYISKKQLFYWMRGLVRQIECFHRCGEDEGYQYVNPYSIIITETEKVLLLDTQAAENEVQIEYMQKRVVRNYFLPEEAKHYQTASLELDIYGIGKTLQFMLAQTVPDPALTMYEEHIFQKIISRCLLRDSTKGYSTIQQILGQIPKQHVKKQDSTKQRNLRKILAILAVCIGIFLLLQNRVGAGVAAAEEEKKTVRQDTAVPESALLQGEELCMEMGCIYLADLQDPARSQTFFSQIAKENPLADCYNKIAVYMDSQADITVERNLEILLSEAEAVLTEPNIRDWCILMRAYALVDTNEASQALIRLGSSCFADTAWQRADAGKKTAGELHELMAQAYEKLDDKENAAKQYELIKETEQEQTKLIHIYERLAVLAEESEKTDQAVTICEEGLKRMPEVKELKLLHIRLLCSDRKTPAAVCAEQIQEYVQAAPVLKEEMELQKLMQQYGFTWKGNKVCVKE